MSEGTTTGFANSSPMPTQGPAGALRGSIDAVKPESEAVREARKLQQNLEMLWATIAELKDRLSPVLRGESPAVVGSDEKQNPTATAIGSEFRMRSDSIVEMRVYIQAILNRLEI